uniref:Uncharacterized protein n=1 Tax=Amphimedon queenslandica TaxID=400682 RepID=A0A1X7TCU2_AMPQE
GQQLYDAAQSGDIDGMRIALSKGADINWKNYNNNNWTPLHVAAFYDRSDAVQWLLSKGTTVDSRDN